MKAKSVFAKNSNKLFLVFCGIAILAGAIPALVASILFGFSQNKTMPSYLNRHLGDALSIDTISKDLVKQNVKWAAKPSNYFVKTYAKINNEVVESDKLLSYDSSAKKFFINGIGDGSIVFTNSMDASLSATVKVSSIFHSDDIRAIFAKDFESIYSDGLVTKDEIRSIKSFSLSKDVDSYDFKDLLYMDQLEKLYVPTFESERLLNATNFDSVCAEAKIYLPEDDYEEYTGLSYLQEHKNHEKLFVNYSEESSNVFSVVLHLNGGFTETYDKSLFFTKTGDFLDVSTRYLMSNVVSKGRHLLYWYTLNNNAEEIFDVYQEIEHDTHVYAKWDGNKYYFRYHFNSVNPEEPDYIEQMYKYDVVGHYLPTSTLLNLAPNAQIKDEQNRNKYRFIGWGHTSNSHEVDPNINDDAEIYEYTETHDLVTDLYAIWVYENVDITYEFGPAHSTYETEVAYSESFLVGHGLGTHWEGYEFKGWGIDQDATAEYETDENATLTRYSDESNKVRVYAVYTTMLRFNLDYYNDNDSLILTDDNGGEGYWSEAPVYFEDVANYVDDSFVVTGKHFIGWKDEFSSVYIYRDYENMVGYYNLPSGYNIVYVDKVNDQYCLPNGITYKAADYKLTAQYVYNYFDVKFVGEGASVFENIPELRYNRVIALDDMAGTTSKVGYNNPNSTYKTTIQSEVTYDFDSVGFTAERSLELYNQLKSLRGCMSNDNKFNTGTSESDREVITFTPIFNPNSYTVTYHFPNHEYDDYSEDFVYDQGYALPTPTKVGYSFNGWYENETQIKQSGQWKFAEDKYLLAKWDLENYTITYNLAGGTGHVTSDTYNYEENKYFTSPTRTGYTFAGWYLTDSIKLESIESHTRTGDITLTAHWTANDCKVYFEKGYNSDTYSSLTKSVKYDSTFTLPGQPEDRSGYDFAGWMYNGSNYAAGTKITYRASSSSITFVAQWDDTCVTGDTLVRMADGTTKESRDVVLGDEILTWDFSSGTTATSTIIHSVKNEAIQRDVIKLSFSDETMVKVIGVHGFFDLDASLFVDITEENYQDFVGHRFAKINENGEVEVVTLFTAVKETEFVDSASFVTGPHLTYLCEDLLTYCGTLPTINILPYDSETMTYVSEDVLSALVEQYGLYPYETLEQYGLPKEIYDMFHLQYLSIMIGRGEITEERIIELLFVFLENFVNEH